MVKKSFVDFLRGTATFYILNFYYNLIIIQYNSSVTVPGCASRLCAYAKESLHMNIYDFWGVGTVSSQRLSSLGFHPRGIMIDPLGH